MRTGWFYLFATVICLMILSEDDKTFDIIRMMINKTIVKMRKVWILSSHLYSCTWSRIWKLDNKKYAFCWLLHEFFYCWCVNLFLNWAIMCFIQNIYLWWGYRLRYHGMVIISCNSVVLVSTKTYVSYNTYCTAWLLPTT